MAADRKELGFYGEAIACRYLRGKGYSILERNFEKKWSAAEKGEIDLVVKKDDIISFVEVKTALKKRGFFPEDKVGFQKQRKLVRLAQSWLVKKKVSLETKWQMDVISIEISPALKKAAIRHLKNAFC